MLHKKTQKNVNIRNRQNWTLISLTQVHFPLESSRSPKLFLFGLFRKSANSLPFDQITLCDRFPFLFRHPPLATAGDLPPTQPFQIRLISLSKLKKSTRLVFLIGDYYMYKIGFRVLVDLVSVCQKWKIWIPWTEGKKIEDWGMYSFSCIRHGLRPSFLIARHLTASRSFSVITGKSGTLPSSNHDFSSPLDSIL